MVSPAAHFEIATSVRLTLRSQQHYACDAILLNGALVPFCQLPPSDDPEVQTAPDFRLRTHEAFACVKWH